MHPSSKFNSAAPSAAVLVQDPAAITSGYNSVRSPDLAGWNEGLVSREEWLAAGGPLDATDRLPCGSAWAWESSSFNCRVHYGSVLRFGAVA